MSMGFGLAEKGKRQAVLLLVTLTGLLFSILPIKYNAPFNIFIPGIFLLVIPVIYLLVWNNETISKRDEIFIFILIMLTVFLNHYIFALKFNYPIGTDALATLISTRTIIDSCKISFYNLPNATAVGFPGLYILYTFLHAITGTNLNTLATYLSPTINMLLFVFFYFFIRRFFEARLSLLAVFLCGWEHTVFKFGFEYRTQSLAIVMYIAILALIAFNKGIIKSTDDAYRNKEKQESIKHTATTIMLILILVSALTITHSVTIGVLNITLLTMYFSYLIAQGIKWKIDLKISITLVILSFSLLIAYMMYLAQIFEGVGEFLRFSLSESFSSANEPLGPTSKAEGLVASLYGPLVFYVTWVTRFVFIGSAIIFIRKSLLKGKRASNLFILNWAGVLFLLILAISLVGHRLNPGRLYNFFAFPFSIILSFGLIYTLEAVQQFKIRRKRKQNKDFNPKRRGDFVVKSNYEIASLRKKAPILNSSIKLLISIFLILFVITSLLKLPNSIIGDTEPFRGYCSVDDIHWEGKRYTNKINSILDSEKTIEVYNNDPGITGFFGKNKIYSNGDLMVAVPQINYRTLLYRKTMAVNQHKS